MIKTIKNAMKLSSKDFMVLFNSPSAYALILFFSFVINFIFVFLTGFFSKGEASLTEYFTAMPLIFILVLPAISMGIFAEELKSGSIELLYSLPISINELVLSKFMALTTFVLILIASTLPSTLTLLTMGNYDLGIVLLQYIGISSFAISIISMGMFISSLTKSQILAYILTVLSLIFITFGSNFLIIFSKESFIGQLLNFISLKTHFDYFNMGILNLSDLIFFFIYSSLFIMLTKYNIILKKWR